MAATCSRVRGYHRMSLLLKGSHKVIMIDSLGDQESLVFTSSLAMTTQGTPKI